MKKILLSFLIILSIGLVGCTDSDDIQNNQNNEDANQQQEDAYDNIKTYNQYSGIGYGTEDGFYYVDVSRDGTQNIKYTDYASATEVYLCNRVECTHIDDSCTSVVTPYGGSVTPIIHNKKIYLLYSGSDNMKYYERYAEQSLPRVVSKDLNGENNKTIFKLEPNQIIVGNISFSDSTVYCVVLSSVETENGIEIKYTLEGYSLNDGKEMFYLDLDMGSPKIITSNEEFIYIEGVNLDSSSQSLQQASKSVYCVNTATYETEKKLDYLITDTIVKANDGILYLIGKNDFSLATVNLDTLEENKFSDNIRPESTFGGVVCITNDGILYMHSKKGDYSDLAMDFYSVEDNRFMDISLSHTYLDEQQQGLEILAENEGSYLVTVNISEKEVSFYGENGELVTFPSSSRENALITKEDYYNSFENYKMISKVN